MSLYSEFKAIWKKLGVKGSIKNYSKTDLWVVETDTTGNPVARILRSGFKTSKDIDFDGFKRVDPLTIILDIKRDSSKNIIAYNVSGYGWLGFEKTFKMTCYHKIDNARPVFPKNGRPYIRSKRDKSILNNFSNRGRA